MTRRRQHDPERQAAEYLAGLQRARARRGFEEHLLLCEECWREVRVARMGRTLGEVAREIAPAHLRDTVRGAVAVAAAAEPARRARQLVAVATAVAVAGLIAVSVLIFVGHGQPAPIGEALAAFRQNVMPVGDAPAHGAPDLMPAGLALRAGAHEMMGGLPVDAFSYLSPRGHRVLLLMSGGALFPKAEGAVDRSDPAPGWEATSDGVMMVCAGEPMSYLLLGDDADLLHEAERALGHPAGSTG